MRQCSCRYAFHAGRNLPDKELRYLRTVIVTAAVYRGFGRQLSPSSLTYRHRAGVRLYTSTYVLAESCVFDKQSQEPIFCGLQQREPPEAPLIANLRGHFAEFLNHRSPERLRLLVSPTCFSFSTVIQLQTLEDFLGHPSNDFLNKSVGHVSCIPRVDLPIPPTQYAPRTFLVVRSHSGCRPSISPL